MSATLKHPDVGRAVIVGAGDVEGAGDGLDTTLVGGRVGLGVDPSVRRNVG